ncbi:hypothetical protein ACFYUY_39420, partial [Kitasatospora sp. NPDC004745]
MAHSTLQVSPGVASFFHILTGMPWPESKEGELRDVRDDYQALSEDLPKLREYIAELVAVCQQQFEGEAADAFTREMGRFIGSSGEDDYLTTAGRLCHELGEFAGKVANTVEYTKWMIIGQIVQLVIEIALAIFWAPFTGGASLLAVEGAKQAAKAIIIALLKKLLQVILTHTFFGVLGALVLDGIIQGIQFAQGNRHEWDKDLTKQAAIFGAISGVIAGPLHLLGMGLGKLFGMGIGKLFVQKELGNSLKGLAGGLAKAGAGDLGKIGGKELGNLGGKELGNVGGKELGSVGGKEAGAGAGHALGDEAANRFAASIDKILRENSSFLGRGFTAGGKSGANAGARFTESLATSFEKHLGDGIGKDLARQLGTRFGEAFVEKWAKSPESRAALATALREIAENSRVANGELRLLAEKLPELAGRVDKLNTMFVLGHALGEQVKMGANQYLSEGFYNLIFEPEHQFTASGASFLAGFLMGGARHLLHAAASPLMTKYVRFVDSLQHADIPPGASKYFGPLHPLTLLSLATNLSGHAVPFPVPRLGEHVPGPTEGGGAHRTGLEGGSTTSLTPPRTEGGGSAKSGPESAKETGGKPSVSTESSSRGGADGNAGSTSQGARATAEGGGGGNGNPRGNAPGDGSGSGSGGAGGNRNVPEPPTRRATESGNTATTGDGPKADPKADPKPDPKADPKPDPKADPRPERKPPHPSGEGDGDGPPPGTHPDPDGGRGPEPEGPGPQNDQPKKAESLQEQLRRAFLDRQAELRDLRRPTADKASDEADPVVPSSGGGHRLDGASHGPRGERVSAFLDRQGELRGDGRPTADSPSESPRGDGGGGGEVPPVVPFSGRGDGLGGSASGPRGERVSA